MGSLPTTRREAATGNDYPAMTRTAIVAISRNGAALGRKLAKGLANDPALYLDRRFLDEKDDAIAFDLPARPLVQRVFQESDQLVLFMPVGAAVRLLAPCLDHKHRDPAVVCVDDAGRFAVSLISGHIGGGDRLAQEVASILGAAPVVTSASHVTGSLAVDLLGQEFGWTVEADSQTITRASAASVNGELVGVYQEAGETGWWPSGQPLPENIKVYPSFTALAESTCSAALIITDRANPEEPGGVTFSEALSSKFVVVYRPRSLAVGVGCRRGVPMDALEQLIDTAFDDNNLAKASINCLATAELKRDEVGIQALAEKLQVPVHCYDEAELNSMFPQDGSGTGPTPSPEPHRLLGIWGVCEPSALLASAATELLVTKTKTDRATVAVARVVFN
jgi:cobalt-precorrin 5A hydrolase